jgi:hypothetical protein
VFALGLFEERGRSVGSPHVHILYGAFQDSELSRNAHRGFAEFLCCGAMKAGTTSLYHYLGQHAQIYMSPLTSKEPNHFAREIRPANFRLDLQQAIKLGMRWFQEYLDSPLSKSRLGGIVVDWADYLKLFQNVTGQKAIGEASTMYFGQRRQRAIFVQDLQSKNRNDVTQSNRPGILTLLHTLSIGVVRTPFWEHILASLHHRGQHFAPTYPFLEIGLYYGTGQAIPGITFLG